MRYNNIFCRVVLSVGCAATIATVYTLRSAVRAAVVDQSRHWMTDPVTDLQALEEVEYCENLK